MQVGEVSISMSIQVLGVIAISAILLVFVTMRVTGPIWQAHGDVEAGLYASHVASSINALSTMESGKIYTEFNGPWNIEVYKKSGILCKIGLKDCGYYVKFSYEGFEGEAKIIGDLPIKEDSLFGKTSITIEKGEEVSIR